MIVNRMHQEFKVQLDKVDSFNSPNFLDEEIDIFLSDAQEQFFETRAEKEYTRNKTGVESTEKRTKDLLSLEVGTIVSPLPNNPTNKPNGVFVVLPPDWRRTLNEEASIQYIDCNGTTVNKRVEVIPINHGQYNDAVRSPFSKPNKEKILRLPYGRFNNAEHYELICDSDSTITSYIIRYLKEPTKIDKAQILSPLGLSGTAVGDFHTTCYREIIAIAVSNALIDISAQNQQSQLIKINNLE